MTFFEKTVIKIFNKNEQTIFLKDKFDERG
jgi:hypothetical protein